MTMRSLAALACAAVALLATAVGASAAERVYVGGANDQLFAFDRNDATGSLTPLAGSPFPSAGLQDGIVASADGARVYVPGHVSQNIFGFAPPPAAGPSMASLPGSPFAAGGEPLVPTLAAGDRFLYVPLDAPQVGPGGLAGFRVGRESGTLRPLAGFPREEPQPFAALADPSGQFLVVSNADPGGGNGFLDVYRINRDTGALTAVPTSPTGTGRNPGNMVFSTDGRFLYVGDVSGGNDTIRAFALDGSTGELTELSGSPYPSGLGIVNDLDVTPNGRFLYAATTDMGGNDKGVSQFSIGADGELTPLSPQTVQFGTDPERIRVSADGRFAYVDDIGSLHGFSVGADGQLDELPDSPFPVGDEPTSMIGLEVAPVPPAPPTPNNGGNTSSAGSTTTSPGTVPLPAGPTTTPTVTSGLLKLLGKRVLRESRGRVAVKVECAADPAFPTCPATVSLRARLGKKLTTLAHSSLDLQAGETKTVRLRLSRTARRYLARHHRLRATLLFAASGRPAAGTSVRLT